MLPEDVLEKVLIRAGWHAVDGGIRAHDTASMRVADTDLEGRGVVLGQVLSRGGGFESSTVVPAPILEVIPGKMLAEVGDDLEVRIRGDSSLEGSDVLVDVSLDNVWVLAWSLLTSAPARVLKRVDVRREEVETGTTTVVERARLSADHGRDGTNELIIERRRHEDG